MNTTNDNGKGKMNINTKILIAILAVLIIGGGYVLLSPSIKEANQKEEQRAAAEQLFGKKQVQEWEDLANGKRKR